MPRKALISLVLITLALGLGVTGDLAGCAWTRVPAPWIPLLTACYYIAILLAAVALGLETGIGAAALASVAHIVAKMMACRESISQQGEVVAFVVFGFLSGVLLKRKQTSDANLLIPVRVAQADPPALREVFQNPAMHGGEQMPVGFVRAVRAPLSAIESAAYVLEDSALTDVNRQELATIILRECHHLEVIIRSLELGQRLPICRETDISLVLNEVARHAAHLAEAAQITLRPENESNLSVVCDSWFLEQALLNLLVNAIQVTKRGDAIILSARRNQSNAIVEISSERIGILAHLGITMAATPESACEVRSPVVEAPFRPEAGAQ